MTAGFRRDQRVGDLIQTALAGILQKESDSLFPKGVLVTLTGVDLSPDLSSAKVFFSVLGGGEDLADEVRAVLTDASKTLRHLLAGAVHLRIVPELRFVFDDSTLRGTRIASLVRDVPEQASE